MARNSRCTGQVNVDILYNGVEIRSDEGCVNETHIYEAYTEGFEGSLIYEWTLDGPYHPENPTQNPILSTTNTFSYTFDDKTHTVYLVVRDANCGAVTTVRAKGRICSPACPVECIKETVSFPGGALKNLKDKFGNTHLFTEALSFECAKNSAMNDKAAKAILAKLKAVPFCNASPISVRWEYTTDRRNCITLTITNSPIKFMSITIDTNKYSFDTKNC